MAKNKQKVEKVGYELRVYVERGPDEKPYWKRCGVFASKYLAECEKRSEYPDAKRFTVQGVRINVERLTVTNKDGDTTHAAQAG